MNQKGAITKVGEGDKQWIRISPVTLWTNFNITTSDFLFKTLDSHKRHWLDNQYLHNPEMQKLQHVNRLWMSQSSMNIVVHVKCRIYIITLVRPNKNLYLKQVSKDMGISKKYYTKVDFKFQNDFGIWLIWYEIIKNGSKYFCKIITFNI